MNRFPAFITVRPIDTWPVQYTVNRRQSQFSASLGDTYAMLARELRLMDTSTSTMPPTVMQLAVKESDLRIDGGLRASATPDHPGVILNIESGGDHLSFPCDTFTHWRDNLRAIALTLEALRKVERYGASRGGQQYRGWRAIESGSSSVAKSSSEADDAANFLVEMSRLILVGSVKSPLSRMKSDVTAARAIYREARKQTHPDRNGGDSTNFHRVEAAGETLRRYGVLT